VELSSEVLLVPLGSAGALIPGVGFFLVMWLELELSLVLKMSMEVFSEPSPKLELSLEVLLVMLSQVLDDF